MTKQRLIVALLGILLVASFGVALVQVEAAGASVAPPGQITFEGPDAGLVLHEAAKFASECDCLILYGELTSLHTEQTRFVILYRP